jgi:hypothetical protein
LAIHPLNRPTFNTAITETEPEHITGHLRLLLDLNDTFTGTQIKEAEFAATISSGPLERPSHTTRTQPFLKGQRLNPNTPNLTSNNLQLSPIYHNIKRTQKMSEISLSFNSGTIISVDMPMSSAKDILNDFKNYLSGGEPTVREYQTNSPTSIIIINFNRLESIKATP